MGQYFRIVNLDKKEWFATDWKLWEICANNGVRMLGYLLATNNPDGTAVTKWFSSVEEAKEKYGDKIEIIACGDGIVCGRLKTKYFGRWCGDRIAIVGDYAEEATNYKIIPGTNPSFHELEENPEWKNITKELIEEFNLFIEYEDLQVKDSIEFILEEVKKKMKDKLGK